MIFQRCLSGLQPEERCFYFGKKRKNQLLRINELLLTQGELHMKIIVLLFYLLLITGCALPVWTKPGASQDEFSKVKYNCMRESQQGYSESQREGYIASSSSGSKTNDQLFTMCMNSHGWYLQWPKKDENKSEPIKNENKSEPKKVKHKSEPKKVEHKSEPKEVENKSEPKIEQQSPTTSFSQMIVTGSKAKIRKKPSTKAAVVKTIKKGEVVQVIKQSDEWFQVELVTGDVGWCHKSVLERRN